MVGVVHQSPPPSGQNEEEKLRRKLSELAGNLSDKGPSSDEEAGRKPFSLGKGVGGVRGGPALNLSSVRDKELSSSSDEMPTEAQKVREGQDCSDWSVLQQVGTWRFLSPRIRTVQVQETLVLPQHGSALPKENSRNK